MAQMLYFHRRIGAQGGRAKCISLPPPSQERVPPAGGTGGGGVPEGISQPVHPDGVGGLRMGTISTQISLFKHATRKWSHAVKSKQLGDQQTVEIHNPSA